MRTFAQLSTTEQALAHSTAINELLEAIIIDGRCGEANHDDLQARIDNAVQAAEDNLTPWLIAEYIMDTCREDIESIAMCDAEDAIYLDAGEHAVYLPQSAENRVTNATP
jgi:hypothetical protein